MITKYQNFTANYFLTRAFFLGIGFSLIIRITKQDSIFAFLIGTIIGIFFIFLINKIQEYKNDKTLDEVLTEMKGLGIFLRIIFLIFGIMLLLEGISFFQLFASTFFLTKTPLYLISLPIILLILKIAQGGIKTTFRVASCLFPLSVTLTFLSLLTLFGYAELDNIMPLFISKPINFIQSTFYYTSLAVTPSMLMLLTKNNNKNNIPSYLLGCFTLILKLFLIIAILGPIMASLYRFPEYIILKEIKLLDFIEKIENIVAISWIFDHFVYVSVASLFIKELLPKKGQSLSHGIIILLIYVLAFMLLGKYYTNELFLYYTMPFFVAIVFIITIPILLIHTHKKRKVSN